MKKVFAIMMLAAALAACTREEQPRIETPAPVESPATYTLTVKASKGTGTRALELVGNSLKATWDGTEKVSAQLNDGEKVAMTIDLGGQSGQASCTLKGTFSQLPKSGDVLTLKLNGNDYKNQGGTLAFIGSNCDYAVATLHVTGVNGGQIESEEGTAKFVNQQAIVKFTLKDKSGAAISPSALTVKGNGTEVATVTGIDANSGGVLFVAIPAISNGTIDLAATVGNDTYTYSKANVTFAAGEYYSITVKMDRVSAHLVNLEDESLYVNGLFTAQDGDVLTGTFPTSGNNKQVRIAPGATVTLQDATIVNNFQYAGVALEGSATIILKGNNLVSGNSHHAGISVSSSGSITIEGDGKLTAQGGYGAAGIGCGSTTSGDEASCGAIIINGGIIEATSGSGAAGIGGGWSLDGSSPNCGAITINAPAQVSATKEWNSPYSIGPGKGGLCGKVTIYGVTYWDGSAGIHDDATLATSPLVIPLP